MKRCPHCNRVETEEALKFCRVDGATLVSDSESQGNETGAAQPGTSPDEVHTSILPHRTDAGIQAILDGLLRAAIQGNATTNESAGMN